MWGKLCGFIRYNVQYVVFVVAYITLKWQLCNMYHYLMSSYHFNLIYGTINITYCTLYETRKFISHVSWATAFCVRKTIFSCRLVQVHLQPVLDFMFLSIADICQLMSHKQQVSEEQSKSAFSWCSFFSFKWAVSWWWGHKSRWNIFSNN
jgi:hypothetical protein